MPKIFLSPSTQEFNPYYSQKNEEYWMNKLADRMEPYLLSTGIQYVRNDPDRNVQGAIADSNKGNYDAHIALHTNAGPESLAGKLRGIDIYYSPYSKDSEKLATIIANNLDDVYPLPDKSVAVPTTSLGEVTKTKAVSILAELGYHDNPQDEEWIINNLNNIAKNLVQSLADYFGIPFIEPTTIKIGVINTGGAGLNLRNYPSITGDIIGSIPNGATVAVYGQYGNWYVVRYGDLVGYANSNYIIIK